LNQFRGKILRMNLDGTAPADNPFYNPLDGISARDYVFAYGVRNPFGGAWRASDGMHYEVENGPSIDRLTQIVRGRNYLWDGSDQSMTQFAIYNWIPSHAPVNITFVQPETFAGSQFPASKMDHLFISESGPTYAPRAQANGKRIVEMVLDANGNLVSGPTTLVEYRGTGQASVVGLAAGPDGLYFSELYKDDVPNPNPFTTSGLAGARIFRVRYVNPIVADYQIDGDVDSADYNVWQKNFGSNLLLAADGNRNGAVDAADYVVWRKSQMAAAAGSAANAAGLGWMPEQTPVSNSSGQAAAASTAEKSVLFEHVSATRFDASRTAYRPVARQAESFAGRDNALLAVLDVGRPAGGSAAGSLLEPAAGDVYSDDAVDWVDEVFERLALLL
jgi:hypothetical protein